MNRAEIAEKYKAVIERRLSKFRNDEAQEFYTKTLPNRLEQFRANYTGAPEKMEAAVEEEEEERVLDFWDYLDDETAEEKEKAISEYAENDADYQPLASEIITDQQEEIEQLSRSRSAFFTNMNFAIYTTVRNLLVHCNLILLILCQGYILRKH